MHTANILYKCSVSLLGGCATGKEEVTCATGESCTFSEAKFNATGSLSLHTRGCVNSHLCELTLTGSLLGAPFTSTYKCCVTDLCNGATSVQLSAALCALSG
uniref:UPAR/Ly6 domain-containing protein n=1 Tax=Xiphophorus maculatus TaxID=8083 RepID=M4AI92_XIPMA